MAPHLDGGDHLSDPERLPRDVKVVSAVSFAPDTASEVFDAVLPLFVVGTLATPPVALGFIEGVAEATSAATEPGAWRLADRRRPVSIDETSTTPRGRGSRSGCSSGVTRSELV